MNVVSNRISPLFIVEIWRSRSLFVLVLICSVVSIEANWETSNAHSHLRQTLNHEVNCESKI